MDGAALIAAAGDPGTAALVPVWIDVAAVAVSAVVGGLIAARERFDFNGVLIVAIVSGLGGGIMRDLLIAQGPPAAMTSAWLLPTAAAAGLFTFFLSRPLLMVHARIRHVILVLDAAALAIYAMVGTAKGIEAGLPVVSCILLGTVTGVGGGILRDVLLNRQPTVLRPGTLEAGAALIGAGVQAVLAIFIPPVVAAIVGLVVILVARLVSAWLRWETPAARTFTEPIRVIPPDEPR